MTFESWKAKVATIVEAKSGLSIDDLPDVVDQWGLFDGGVSPAMAAAEILEEAGFPAGRPTTYSYRTD